SGSDAAKAFKSIWILAAAPEQAVPFLQQQLRPAAAPDRARVAQLVTDLDSNRFAVREKAAEELEKLGESAEPALRKVLQSDSSPEVRRRAGQLLAKLAGPVTSAQALRAIRGVMVLEQIGTPEAQEILKDLATGAAEARLTREAKAALDRLACRRAG